MHTLKHLQNLLGQIKCYHGEYKYIICEQNYSHGVQNKFLVKNTCSECEINLDFL